MGKGPIRWIVFLAIILAGLVYTQYSKSRRTSTPHPIFEKERDAVRAFAIWKLDRRIELAIEEEKWRILGNDSLEVRETRLDDLFDKVLASERSTVMTEKPDRWETYSVDDSAGTHLELTGEGGERLGKFVFGQSRRDWSKSYVRMGDNPTVYLTTSSVVFHMNPSESFWGEPPKPDTTSVKSDVVSDTTGTDP